MTKWNVPGGRRYTSALPLDNILNSQENQEKRGYWLGRTADGNVCIVSNQNGADAVTLDVDVDGAPIVRWDDTTEEFRYEDYDGSIRIERYS